MRRMKKKKRMKRRRRTRGGKKMRRIRGGRRRRRIMRTGRIEQRRACVTRYPSRIDPNNYPERHEKRARFPVENEPVLH